MKYIFVSQGRREMGKGWSSLTIINLANLIHDPFFLTTDSFTIITHRSSPKASFTKIRHIRTELAQKNPHDINSLIYKIFLKWWGFLVESCFSRLETFLYPQSILKVEHLLPVVFYFIFYFLLVSTGHGISTKSQWTKSQRTLTIKQYPSFLSQMFISAETRISKFKF